MDLHEAWEKWMTNQRMISDDQFVGESTTDKEKREAAEQAAKHQQARSESLRRGLKDSFGTPRWKHFVQP